MLTFKLQLQLSFYIIFILVMFRIRYVVKSLTIFAAIRSTIFASYDVCSVA